VVLPTYNEAKNLPLMAAELWSLKIPGLSILVVDDNSTDGTGQIADDLAKRQPSGLAVIHQRNRRGLGKAYIAGFKWALEEEAEVIIQMDCDFSHSPNYIQEMLTVLEDTDVVVGSRYIEGGKLDERWGAGRYLLSWWANTVYTRAILKFQVRDATSGFKCWRAAALRGIDLDAIKSSGYSFHFEMAYLTEKLGYRVIEIPIHFEDRRIGESRLTLPNKIEAAYRAWDIRWRYRNYPRPDPHPNSTNQGQGSNGPDAKGRNAKGRNAPES
jgi:dolichol-phosphate mannosyltransferase